MFFEDHLIDTSDSEEAPKESGEGVGEERSVTNVSQSQRLHAATDIGSQLPSRSRDVVSSSAVDNSSGEAFSSIVPSLIEATENERHCPDILFYPKTLIDTVMSLIKRQKVQVQQLSRAEKQAAAEEAFGSVSFLPFKLSDIMTLELQRLTFFLCELLRCRLRKIEALCLSIYYEGLILQGSTSMQVVAVNAPQRSHLSPNECLVADRLAIASQRAVLEAGLYGVPEPLQHLVPHPPEAEGAEILPESNLNTYVFGVALEDLGLVKVGEHAEQSVQTGDLFLMPYRTFRPYVIAGQVRLV